MKMKTKTESFPPRPLKIPPSSNPWGPLGHSDRKLCKCGDLRPGKHKYRHSQNVTLPHPEKPRWQIEIETISSGFLAAAFAHPRLFAAARFNPIWVFAQPRGF